MVGALLYLGFFALITAVFAGVVLSRPPRRWTHGAAGAVVVVLFFAVLGWAMVRFLFSAMAP
jgi:hypothetical protein